MHSSRFTLASGLWISVLGFILALVPAPREGRAADAPGMAQDQKTLTWTPADGDVFCYRIYRSKDGHFGPGRDSLLTYVATNTTSFQDKEPDFEDRSLQGTQYYRVTAVDKAGNESAATPAVAGDYGNVVAGILVDAPQAAAKVSGVWPDGASADCPFPKSAQFGGVEFTGRHAEYGGADTWYPSWASDDKMYSPFTDGSVNGVFSGSGYNFDKLKSPVTGFAVIEGRDPLALKITRVGVIPHEPFPYGGQYPCGTLVLNGVWYYGTYCLDWQKDPWDIMGPFPGFNISTNLGQTWEPETRTAKNPLIGESAKDGKPVLMWNKAKEYAAWSGKSGTPGAKVKIGAPHFVDFGKNMEYSPDGKAYLVAQGSVRTNAYNSWAAADQVYLIRVKPSQETINDPKAYEFFAGHDAQGQPVWSGDFDRIKPLLEWNDHMGVVTATYVPGLKKYLMCVTDGRGLKVTGNGPYDTYILESEALTGPWKRVTYMKAFGAQAYFVNFPSKFISADGHTLWVCYAHGWSCNTANPPGSRYAMCLQEIRLLAPDDSKLSPKPEPKSILDMPENVARKAKATASSHFPDCPPEGAINGVVGGLDLTTLADEWSAQGEHAGAWLRLTWDQPQKVNRVWLFDRPSNLVQVMESELRFSDNSTLTVGELPDDARQGRQVDFPVKIITWLEVRITKTRTDHAYIGQSEVAVFNAGADNKKPGESK